MESFLIAVGAMVPMLLVLVVVHEFGHYATARKLGVKVLEFGADKIERIGSATACQAVPVGLL